MFDTLSGLSGHTTDCNLRSISQFIIYLIRFQNTEWNNGKPTFEVNSSTKNLICLKRRLLVTGAGQKSHDRATRQISIILIETRGPPTDRIEPFHQNIVDAVPKLLQTYSGYIFQCISAIMKLILLEFYMSFTTL